jgi:hypothetical protein
MDAPSNYSTFALRFVDVLLPQAEKGFVSSYKIRERPQDAPAGYSAACRVLANFGERSPAA